MAYTTDQENFWAGDFGDQYISRNDDPKQVAANVALWSKILEYLKEVNSFLEFGCNIGLNLDALKQINQQFHLGGIEINEKARAIALERGHEVRLGSITEPSNTGTADVCFTSGVLIHINPDKLNVVYENLVRATNKYMVIIENYNPTPVEVSYRGHGERLFKRDFAGEIMQTFNFSLKGYGFVYHKDEYFPQDDINWFVLEKLND